jgi:hypothetical protein
LKKTVLPLHGIDNKPVFRGVYIGSWLGIRLFYWRSSLSLGGTCLYEVVGQCMVLKISQNFKSYQISSLLTVLEGMVAIPLMQC